MGILPVGVKWEVQIEAKPWQKLYADILIFRRDPDDPNSIKQLVLDENVTPGAKNSRWKVEERRTDMSVQSPAPTLQLPWEVLEPLAAALRELGVDSAGDGKLAGRLQAQAEHLKDLRDIALAFIQGGNKSLVEQKPKEEAQ